MVFKIVSFGIIFYSLIHGEKFLFLDPESGSVRNTRSFKATLGLVVHAAGESTFAFVYFTIDDVLHACFNLIIL